MGLIAGVGLGAWVMSWVRPIRDDAATQLKVNFYSAQLRAEIRKLKQAIGE